MRYWLLVRCLRLAGWLARGPYAKGLLADAEGDSGYHLLRQHRPDFV